MSGQRFWREDVGWCGGTLATPHLRHVDVLMGVCLAELSEVRVVVPPVWIEVAKDR